MIRVLAFGGTILPLVSAKWQTVYEANYSAAYMQSTNGSLYHLRIPDTSLNQQDITKQMTQLPSAPTNSTLVLDNDGHLFAVWGSKGSGQSSIEISKFDSKHNQWVYEAQSDGKTQQWYQDSQIVWIDRSQDAIYLFGGECKGETQSGFYRYNLGNKTFEEMTTSGGIMPHDMSDAQAVPLDDYSTMIVGGKTENAWISTKQVAIWGYGSWTFNAVGNSTGIDSRENPLLLPIFTLGENGSTGALNELLVIGGTVAGRQSEPAIVVLKHTDSTGWFWSKLDQSSNSPNVSFAASNLYNILANVNKDTNSISLYGRSRSNSNSMSPVPQASVVKLPSKGHKSMSTAVIAVVSTLLPVIVIALALGAGCWYWRRRREHRLFLGSNRQGMLGRQDSSAASSMRSWGMRSWGMRSWGADKPLPMDTAGLPRRQRNNSAQQNDNDAGSIMLSNDGNFMMSKQRRSLRVVNPDADNINTLIETDEAITTTKHNSASAGSSRHSSQNSDPFDDKRASDRQSEFDFGI